MQHHHDHLEALRLLFLAANLVIAAGYVSVPFLVLPYLPVTRLVRVFGTGLFAGCCGTHLWMAFGDHVHSGWFWTIEHLAQAVCTWGFILAFRTMLRKAARRRHHCGGGGGR